MLLLSVLARCKVQASCTQRPLTCMVATETWKDFCGKASHQFFPVIKVILHRRPLGCREKHTLHYLEGQSLRIPSVFGPAEEQGSKNITSVMCDFLCHINGTPRYVHLSLKLYFNMNVAKACDDLCCGLPRGVLDSPLLLQSFVWWTGRQLSMEELSKLLTLIDTIACGGSELSYDRRYRSLSSFCIRRMKHTKNCVLNM